jgi:hypothetical protein
MTGGRVSELSDALIGHKIVKAYTQDENGYLVLDDGTVVEIDSNDGCGGCSAGWYDVTHVATVDNVITNVVEDCEANGYEESYKYTIFVYCGNEEIAVAIIEGDDGNGYYGSGYYINVNHAT